jgi:hypothetical protein
MNICRSGCQRLIHTLKLSVIFPSKCQNFAPSGVDVMITIFCDFRQFSAKKIGVFLKNQCYDQLFFKIWLCFETKTPIFFAEFFGKNILKTITSVPGHTGNLEPILRPCVRIRNNASIVNFYNARVSLARFENKNVLFYFEKRSSLPQRWRCTQMYIQKSQDCLQIRHLNETFVSALQSKSVGHFITMVPRLTFDLICTEIKHKPSKGTKTFASLCGCGGGCVSVLV